MVSGHLGIAFAIRAARCDVSLPVLIVAAIAPDILDGAYKLAGFYQPLGIWSHSIPATAVLALAAFGLTAALTRRGAASTAVALAVLLHLPADLVTGEKLLWPGGPIGGLVLYDYPIVDFLIELPIAIGGWWLLRRNRDAPLWATGVATLAVMIGLQVVFDIYQINIG